MFSASFGALLNGRRCQFFASFEIMFYLVKNPWITNARPANHDTIHSVAVFVLKGFFRSSYITVSENRNMDPLIFLYPRNERPVGLSLVHLNACSSMNGECLYTNILKAFGHI